ncbi:hypothetical protein G6F31_015502 [Rhizopus arrhizus]|nr:hypothetical protein G6F31_015502 [Rhizopus arrhizus]
MAPPTRSIHVVAAVITDARGRVLLNRRTENRDMAGLWEFPGGKRESGETAEQALVRELREELGIEADVAPDPGSAPCAQLEGHAARARRPGDHLGGAGQAGPLFDAAGRPAGGGGPAPARQLPDHPGAGRRCRQRAAVA